MHKNIIISEFHNCNNISRATKTLFKLTIQQNSYNQIFSYSKDQNSNTELKIRI